MASERADQVYPLLGSIQNSVGMGFLGNEAVAAIANPLRVRLACVPSSYASARGGIDGRLHVVTEPRGFRRGVEFVIAQRPSVLLVGYLPTAEHASIVAESLREYKGLVVLDPVMGDYRRGLYVSPETARIIRSELLPHAQIVTPNRFEAELLLDLMREKHTPERALLDGLAAAGPQTAVVTSFARNSEERTLVNAFSNGYRYFRFVVRLYAGFPAYGAGDVFSATLAVMLALEATPLAAALVATALASLSVLRTTSYGANTVDPAAALQELNPGPCLSDEAALQFCEKAGVLALPIPGNEDARARLKFNPPANRSVS